MPFDDWQFWVVTMACLIGVCAVLRPFLPRKQKSGCSHCAAGSAASARKRPAKVSLTIEKKRV